MSIKLKGTKKVLKELNKEIKAIKGKTKIGMITALLFIKGQSIIRTPIDTGNLRLSHFTDVKVMKDKIVGIIGASAEYAIYVHENLESKHTIGEAKFLELAIVESRNIILKIIRKFAKV